MTLASCGVRRDNYRPDVLMGEAMASVEKDLNFSDADLYWMAGLFEGEASFMKPGSRGGGKITSGPQFAINMVDEDVIARVAGLLGVSYGLRPPAQEGWQEQYYVRCAGRWVYDLMLLLRPLMGERRKAQIDAATAEVSMFYPNPCARCGEAIPRPTLRPTRGFMKFCGECKPEADRERVNEWQKEQLKADTPYAQRRRDSHKKWAQANPDKVRANEDRRLHREREARGDFYPNPCEVCDSRIPRPRDRRTNPHKKFCSEDCKQTSLRERRRSKAAQE